MLSFAAGNPTNIIVAVAYQMSFADYSKWMALPTLGGCPWECRGSKDVLLQTTCSRQCKLCVKMGNRRAVFGVRVQQPPWQQHRLQWTVNLSHCCGASCAPKQKSMCLGICTEHSSKKHRMSMLHLATVRSLVLRCAPSPHRCWPELPGGAAAGSRQKHPPPPHAARPAASTAAHGPPWCSTGQHQHSGLPGNAGGSPLPGLGVVAHHTGVCWAACRLQLHRVCCVQGALVQAGARSSSSSSMLRDWRPSTGATQYSSGSRSSSTIRRR